MGGIKKRSRSRIMIIDISKYGVFCAVVTKRPKSECCETILYKKGKATDKFVVSSYLFGQIGAAIKELQLKGR